MYSYYNILHSGSLNMNSTTIKYFLSSVQPLYCVYEKLVHATFQISTVLKPTKLLKSMLWISFELKNFRFNYHHISNIHCCVNSFKNNFVNSIIIWKKSGCKLVQTLRVTRLTKFNSITVMCYVIKQCILHMWVCVCTLTFFFFIWIEIYASVCGEEKPLYVWHRPLLWMTTLFSIRATQVELQQIKPHKLKSAIIMEGFMC